MKSIESTLARESGMCRCTMRVAVVLLCVPPLSPAQGQTHAERFIRGLDTNGSGYIAPEEITTSARRQLEKFARYGRLDLSRPNSIGRWMEAVRRYHERRRSGDRRVVPKRQEGIAEFGPSRETPQVPGFGIGQVKYAYTQEDLDEADDTLRRADRNDDGYVDRVESRRTRWTRTDPFESDFNQDGRLNRLELAQRYATRRMLEDGRERRYESARRARDDQERSARSRRRPRDPSIRRVRNLADGLMDRYDANRNRILEPRELDGVGIDLSEADLDRNDMLIRDELEKWLAMEIEERAVDLAEVLPAWFFELDTNQDGQIQMAEYAEEWDNAKADEFEVLDSNEDGILTSVELLKSSAIVGGTFVNQKAELIAPGATVVSEIEVTEDYLIGDLNVQLSITHTYTSHLDGYLIGPDGQRVELFTGVGREDDHFDGTVFDDEARAIITKARPPFRGSFRPESMEKKGQPRLSRYKNKNLKGLWQLMLRASRSDRPGMLHSWSLIVKPADAGTGDGR